MGTMSIFSYLAILPLATAEESGFGLNLNIFETNLINLGILVWVLVAYGSKLLVNVLNERRARIEEEIKDAETRASEAANALAQAQQDLAQAQVKAEQIRKQANETAQQLKQDILGQSGQEVAKIRAAAVAELDTEQAKVMAELRQRIAVLAIEKVETQLKERLDDHAQGQLVDRCIAQLGGN
jgi:F-type H+-transporting ATPase subunit b